MQDTRVGVIISSLENWISTMIEIVVLANPKQRRDYLGYRSKAYLGSRLVRGDQKQATRRLMIDLIVFHNRSWRRSASVEG